MGAINYGTSQCVTIGLKPFDADEFTDDEGNVDYFGMDGCAQDIKDDVEVLMGEYDFNFFCVKMEFGYYEGFYIDIKDKLDKCFDSVEDKQAAIDEVIKLKEFLTKCVELGLCRVYPGWCPGYDDETDSVDGIAAAMEELKDNIENNIPVWDGKSED